MDNNKDRFCKHVEAGKERLNRAKVKTDYSYIDDAQKKEIMEEECCDSSRLDNIMNWMKEHKKAIFVIGGGIAGLTIGVIAIFANRERICDVTLKSQKSIGEINPQLDASSNAVSSVILDDVLYSNQKMATNYSGEKIIDNADALSKRYRVDFKAFTSGEWYPKTETDSKASAYSVAVKGNYGRACRLIDTFEGRVLFETPEDITMKETNGYL